MTPPGTKLRFVEDFGIVGAIALAIAITITFPPSCSPQPTPQPYVTSANPR